MTGSIFLFNRLIEDGGKVRQFVSVFAPDLNSARSLLASHLEEGSKTSGPAPEYELVPTFNEWEVSLDAPTIVTSNFSHL
jgi:hypothetical protein